MMTHFKKRDDKAKNEIIQVGKRWIQFDLIILELLPGMDLQCNTNFCTHHFVLCARCVIVFYTNSAND